MHLTLTTAESNITLRTYRKLGYVTMHVPLTYIFTVYIYTRVTHMHTPLTFLMNMFGATMCCKHIQESSARHVLYPV